MRQQQRRRRQKILYINEQFSFHLKKLTALFRTRISTDFLFSLHFNNCLMLNQRYFCCYPQEIFLFSQIFIFFLHLYFMLCIIFFSQRRFYYFSLFSVRFCCVCAPLLPIHLFQRNLHAVDLFTYTHTTVSKIVVIAMNLELFWYRSSFLVHTSL